MDNYQLVNKDKQWSLRKENSERSIRKFKTKTEAIGYANEFMKKKKTKLKIFKADGSLQEQKDYSAIKAKTKAKAKPKAKSRKASKKG